MLLRPTTLLVLTAAARPATSFASHSSSTIFAAGPAVRISSRRSFSSATKLAMSESKPISIIVEADIKPERVDEFLDLIEKNAKGSRQEPGCQRFDVLRSQDDPNKFFFYEVYDNADAVAHHKAQPHFDLWTKFKESEGIVTSVSKKAVGEFMT